MTTERTSRGGANALNHELVARFGRRCGAPPWAVYELLADLPSHVAWGGEQQAKSYRLLSMEAPGGPAVVGTEFTTRGADPMGEFLDRSVVTEAVPGSLFEFVTEARFTTKKGQIADWTNVHRYEIRPAGEGSEVTYEIRVKRISALPGMLRLFNSPLSGLLMKWAVLGPKRGLRNLIKAAEESGGRTSR